jgi:hypothetical protein
MAAMTSRMHYCCHHYAFTPQLNIKWQAETRAQSVKRYANISPVFDAPPPLPEGVVHKNSNNFATRTLGTIEVSPFIFFYCVKLSLHPYISFPKDMFG